MNISELDRKGEVDLTHSLAFNHWMFIPPFAGIDAVANVEGLCNAKGFVIIDEHQGSPTFSNIFAGGSAWQFRQLKPHPCP
jgi:sulfide:quinone oxidoreductase